MKCTMLFVVLSMVVLMAEPGDAFFHHIVNGIIHAGKTIHHLIHGGGNKEQQLEQRWFNREQLERERAAFKERV